MEASDQIILELQKYYTENPPDSIEDEKLRLETFALDYLLKKSRGDLYRENKNVTARITQMAKIRREDRSNKRGWKKKPSQ